MSALFASLWPLVFNNLCQWSLLWESFLLETNEEQRGIQFRVIILFSIHIPPTCHCFHQDDFLKIIWALHVHCEKLENTEEQKEKSYIKFYHAEVSNLVYNKVLIGVHSNFYEFFMGVLSTVDLCLKVTNTGIRREKLFLRPSVAGWEHGNTTVSCAAKERWRRFTLAILWDRLAVCEDRRGFCQGCEQLGSNRLRTDWRMTSNSMGILWDDLLLFFFKKSLNSFNRLASLIIKEILIGTTLSSATTY